MKHCTALRSLVTILLSFSMSAWAQSTWNGGTDTNWSTASNWDAAPSNGDNLIFGSAFTSGTTLNNDALTSVGSITFTGLPAGGITLSGNALAIGGGLANNNTSSANPVVVDIDLNVSGSQTWTGANVASSITTISGNLSGSGNILIDTPGSLQASGDGSLPSFRLSGDNSAYTGNINLVDQRRGLALMNPSAMTGGNIDLGLGAIHGGNVDRRYLYITGSDASTPYTFGIGSGAGEVSFNNSSNGSGGLVHDGNQWLRLGGSGNYTLNHPSLYVEGRFSGSTGALTLGSAGETLFLDGTYNSNVKAIKVDGTGIVDLQYALNDTAQSGRTLRKTGTGLLILNHATGGAQTTVNGLQSGLLSVSNMNQLFDGNLQIGNNNGTGIFVFNGMSWADFAADRTEGTGDNQWRLLGSGSPGFAARGSDVTIDTSSTSSSTFDRNISLGSTIRGPDGSYYANAGLEVQVDTALTSQRTYTIGWGSGRLGDAATSPVYEFSGNLTGAGALLVSGPNATTTGGTLIVSGSLGTTGNTWVPTNTNGFNTGPGGVGAYSGSFLQFASPSSLPTGAPANTTAYIAGLGRNNGTAMEQGVLFGASGTDYVLNPTATVSDAAYKLVIGGNAGGQWRSGSFGAAGTATLAADVLLMGDSATSTTSMGLIAREGTFTLGTGSQSLRFVPITSPGTANNGVAGAANTVTDATGGVKTLVKTGEGTVLLNNVAYTDLSGTALGTPSSRIGWQIGRGSGNNTTAAPYFDGAVRETGNTAANSLSGFNIALAGGVLETSDAILGGSFTRALGTGTSQVRFTTGGGGFAAGGGDLTVNIGGAAASINWNASNFVPNNNPLMFGSQTADGIVTFQNGINLAGATREIRVYDNAGSAGDKAVISGVISGSSLTSGFVKTGDGRLELSGPNTYLGSTTVSAGTLALTGGSNVGYEYVVSSGTSFLHTGGTWVMGNSADNLFHINGSGSTIQVADLADANDGSGVIRYTLDAGGVSPIVLNDSTPFGQYGDSASDWANEWTIDLKTSFGLNQDEFQPTLTLFSSSAYTLTGLNNLLTITAWDGNNFPTTYSNVTDGQKIYISSGGALAEYQITFGANSIELEFLGAFGIPEPGTVSLIGLALLALRRRIRRGIA